MSALSAAEIAALPYRPCVGIMLLNKQNQVFVGQRLDNMVEAWQMPQGGIDEGEEPLEAARRELREETGVTQATLLCALEEWLDYDVPAELVPQIWGGRFRGQRQKWFAFRLDAADSHITIATEHAEFAAWKWVNLEDLPDLIVPFKRALYEKLVASFKPLLMP